MKRQRGKGSMAIGIQDQYFGTEIEMTGITRQRAAGESGESCLEQGRFAMVDIMGAGL